MNKILGAIVVIGLAAACAGPASTTQPPAATTQPSAGAASPVAVAVTEQDFKILPATMTVTSNVEFDVHSDGPTPHNFNVRDASGTVLLSTKDLRAGDSASVTGQLPPGTYTFFCAFAGHESLGMHGTLTVTAN